MKFFFRLLAISMLICINASAEELEEVCFEDNRNLYAEIFGGANFLQTSADGGIKSNYKTGYVIGGALGYNWCYGIRLEAEYAFRRNIISSIHFFGRTFSTDGHFKSLSFMANMLWDIPVDTYGWNFCDIQPYIGFGIGYDIQKVNWHNELLLFNGRKKGFAWQIMLGGSYPLLCDTNISLEYKFHRGGFNYINNHSLDIGLNYQFGL